MSKPLGAVSDSMPLHLDRDYSSYDGAQVLANRIRAYWAQHTIKQPNVMVVGDPANRKQGSDGRAASERWNVRSDMIGGWP